MEITKVKVHEEIRYTYLVISSLYRLNYNMAISSLYSEHKKINFDKVKYEKKAQEFKDLLLDDIYEDSVSDINDIHLLDPVYHSIVGWD